MTTPDFSYSVFVEIKQPTSEIREGEPAVARRVHTTCEQLRTPNNWHGQESLPQKTAPPPESWKPQNLSSRERAQGVYSSDQMLTQSLYTLKTATPRDRGRLPDRQPRPDAHFRAGPRLRPQNAGAGEVRRGGLWEAEGSEAAANRTLGRHGSRNDSARNQSAIPFRDVVSALLLRWGTASEVSAPTATIAAVMPLVHVGAAMPPTQRQTGQSGQGGDLKAARRRRRIQSALAGTR